MGHLLARAGDAAGAAEALIVAIGLTTDGGAKAYLQEQLRLLRR